jgi:hypothetical protein
MHMHAYIIIHVRPQNSLPDSIISKAIHSTLLSLVFSCRCMTPARPSPVATSQRMTSILSPATVSSPDVNLDDPVMPISSEQGPAGWCRWKMNNLNRRAERVEERKAVLILQGMFPDQAHNITTNKALRFLLVYLGVLVQGEVDTDWKFSSSNWASLQQSIALSP